MDEKYSFTLLIHCDFEVVTGADDLTHVFSPFYIKYVCLLKLAKMLLKEYNCPSLSLCMTPTALKHSGKSASLFFFFPSIGCAGSLLGHVGFSLW